MGLRGPAPKATNLRILEGNPSKRPLNDNEPQPEAGAICPEWLSEDAQEEWERLAPVLEACGILTKADQYTLAAYCEAVSGYKAATLAVAQRGMVMQGERQRKVSPEMAAQRNYAEQMIKFGTKLGLSPGDRASIKVPGPKQQSIWDEYGSS